jgi:HSP20 family molecular chaperone IbpA
MCRLNFIKVKVVIEAPGFKPAYHRHQWAFRMGNQNLYLRGKLDSEKSIQSDFGTFYKERSNEQFTKIIPLPSSVKCKPSSVHYEDGLVTIVLDKHQAAPAEEEWHPLNFSIK